jgi:hypothetical protein
MVLKFGVTISEDKVINIENKDYEMTYYFLVIEIRIRMTSRKASVKRKVVHFDVPNSGSLLETIKRFLKATNKARVLLDIAGRLFHVDFFFQIPMQEGVFDIHLMDLPFM